MTGNRIASRFSGFHRHLTSLMVSLFFSLLGSVANGAETSISITASPRLLATPCVHHAVNDCLALLKRAFPGPVALNAPRATVTLRLDDPSPPPARTSPGYPVLAAPASGFSWTSRNSGEKRTLILATTSPEGVAAGLYALLQEELGFRFIHPRQTLIPTHRSWPLPPRFSFSGEPRFPNRGFHLHTLHPAELTEQLMDPALPGALADVACYLDWLARNGQNTFQFFLLRDVDRSRWIPHARSIVRYAHQRGIKCGVEISLAMLQQQAFQLVTLLRPFPSYQSQADRTLDWLFQAPWDFVTLESTMGEYLPELGTLLPELQRHIEQTVAHRYGARPFVATHVIRRKDGSLRQRPLLPESGILIHSVMCYSACEPSAPVYGNLNQCFLLDSAVREKRRRETWYWPESSYWVGFDTSVPLLLLTYLDSRFEDLDRMAKLGLSGHLTFSSGWEWGYWLTDWSVARWSWSYRQGNRLVKTSPLSRVDDLFDDPELRKGFHEALTLQNRFLKERQLQAFLSALTPFAELPPSLVHPFQPSPPFDFAWLRFSASSREAARLTGAPLLDLAEYSLRMGAVCDRLERRSAKLTQSRGGEAPYSLADELTTGLRVGALRARHRALTLEALITAREEGGLVPLRGGKSERLLQEAAGVRRSALGLVERQEGRYRYPASSLARRRPSHTAYQFGYLYPASELFFWRREEEQVRQSRFDPFFLSIWDPWSVVGLESLFMGSSIL